MIRVHADPKLARALRISSAIVLVALVYWSSGHTPPSVRLGILYIVPVLLVTWHDGLSWGVAFAVGTGVLRFMTGLEKLPPDTSMHRSPRE